MSDNQKDLRFAVLATDVVLFAMDENELKTLLINVETPPHFTDINGFPGGLIDPDETAIASAKRHLENKGGVPAGDTYLEQLYTFSEIDRDPRGRVVSVAYFGLIPSTNIEDSLEHTTWKSTVNIEKLAYDHNQILDVALDRLRSKVSYTNIIKKMMPDQFTLTQLQDTYEVILQRDLDKRNFRRKIKAATSLEKTGDKSREGAHRPASLYRFASREVHGIEFL